MLLDYITPMGCACILLPDIPPAHGERISDPFIKKQDQRGTPRGVYVFFGVLLTYGIGVTALQHFIYNITEKYFYNILEKIFLSSDSWL